MSDALYLSLWFPNLRLADLAEKLVAALGAFARHGGEPRVYSATVWPVNWHEAPVFQRVWGRSVGPAEAGETPQVGAEPRAAVKEALELLHEDFAYEFQIGWSLWEIEDGSAGGEEDAGPSTPVGAATSAQGDGASLSARRWAHVSRLVRVTGFGPLFDEGAYEQDGHIRIDFGSDAPFLEEAAELDAASAQHLAQNVRELVDLTAAVEKASGATARLLWSELGESLAQRLAERLSKGN